MDYTYDKLTKDEQEFLSTWEEIYKRGHLTFWILLALYSGAHTAQNIVTFMERHALDFSVNEQSLYRALRRYDDVGLIIITKGDSNRQKHYRLSETGKHVLKAFITRNIVPLQDRELNKIISELLI